jgi:iron uptake system EfeUOB component EfeO/EfeM
MKMKLCIAMIVLAGVALSPLHAQEKSVSQKAAETWDKTKATTKKVSNTVVKKTREAADRVEMAVREPDADARKVNVTVSDKGVQMPKSLPAGKTAFVVKNSGKQAHNFEIEGSGVDKSFWFAIDPNQSKTMQVDLKPGEYEAICTAEQHGKEQKVKLVVK